MLEAATAVGLVTCCIAFHSADADSCSGDVRVPATGVPANAGGAGAPAPPHPGTTVLKFLVNF